MKIGIASDHRGYQLKQYLISELKMRNYQIIDYGVAICGSGIGISIACNKVKGIRCAKVSNQEEAKVTRIDNDANIVAFGEKVPKQEALDIVITFLKTPSSNLEKHQRRIKKILEYEENHK